MRGFYVPYNGRKPAFVEVNGHRLLILSRTKRELENSLDLFGGNRIRKIVTPDSFDGQADALVKLAERAKAGVVVAEDDLNLSDVIKNLESSLPWIH